MRSVNKVILIGNLTRDPERRETPNGQSVVTFGIATNREWVTKDGRKENSAEFHDLVAWAKLADICSQYLSKGKLIYVEGYLKTRSWDTPEGIKKFRTEVVVQDMIMLDKRGESSTDEYTQSSPKKDNPQEEKASVETGSTEEPSAQKEEIIEPQAETPSEVSTDKEAPEQKKEEPATNQSIDINTDLGL